MRKLFMFLAEWPYTSLYTAIVVTVLIVLQLLTHL